jgi:hypothetical protein
VMTQFSPSKTKIIFKWKCGRVVYCTGLENRRGFIALREFESHRFRQVSG